MSVSLSHLEFDLLWEHLGVGELPYPFEVRSFGETLDERVSLREQVRASLQDKGLHDGREVDPRLEAQLAMLVRNEASIDGQLSVGDHLKVLAARAGRQAVLVAQTDAELRVAAVRQGRLVPAVVALLPEEKPGPGGAARLPRVVFDSSLDEFTRNGYVGLERTLTSGGVTGRALRSVITLVESSRKGGGQLAVNTVDALGRRARTPVLNWFDTSAGRYLVHGEVTSDRVEWLTIAPADTARVEQKLTELAASVGVR